MVYIYPAADVCCLRIPRRERYTAPARVGPSRGRRSRAANAPCGHGARAGASRRPNLSLLCDRNREPRHRGTTVRCRGQAPPWLGDAPLPPPVPSSLAPAAKDLALLQLASLPPTQHTEATLPTPGALVQLSLRRCSEQNWQGSCPRGRIGWGW